MDKQDRDPEADAAATAAATEVLDTLLGYLGFPAQIEEDIDAFGPALQVSSSDSELLIGRRGERLEDLQFLVNRIVRERLGNEVPRVRVDVGFYRAMREDKLRERVLRAAEGVRRGGSPAELPPMNAFHRRMVHELLKDDAELETVSPKGRDRVKAMTIRRRNRKDSA